MGIKDRLKFIAKSYINSILDGSERRTRVTPEDDPDIRIVDDDDDLKKMSDDEFEKQWAAFEEEQRRYRAQQAKSDAGGAHQGPRRAGSERSLAQCYQNLECPMGSDLKIVRANFRRLMKKYHPDLQPKDKRSQEAAVRITQI